MVRRLQEEYIPAVGEHLALTRGPLARWWAETVRQANPGYRGGSTQGYYVLAADGAGLAWDNYLPRLPEFLERGLATFRRAGAVDRDPPRELRSTPSPEAPEGASVLRLYTRLHPPPAGAGPMYRLLGRDYMWVLAEEVAAILSASERESGAFAAPESLAARLVLFHMVDNTRGSVWAWSPSSVRSARLSLRRLRDRGALRTFSVTGSYRKQDSHPPQWTDRGQEGSLEGELEIDTRARKIVRMRVLADSTAWSDATYDRNFPPPPGRYPILTAIVDAQDDLARRVAPEPSLSGGFYLRPPVAAAR